METVKRGILSAGRWLAARRDGLVSGIKGIAENREKRLRIGYYMGLAVLLALLGLGSHAWRMRSRSGSEIQSEPRQAMAMQLPTLEPVPLQTPEPEHWAWPLEGEILADYSPEDPVWSETLGQWQTHSGLDISGSPGEAVCACRDGVVTEAWNDRLWGNVVVIEHDEGYRSTYAGLNTLEMVEEGGNVAMGQVIGSVGQSAACEAEQGWHVHFELTKDGVPVDFKELVS